MTLSHKTFFILFLTSILTLSMFTFSNSASAQELQKTQIVASIPEEYNELFKFQWGGGSLYQLKQRFATMKCIVDTLFIYNNNQWNAYNQYQIPSSINQQFNNQYQEFIPAGTHYASCYRICEFGSVECVTFDIRMERINEYTSKTMVSLRQSNSICTDDFDPRVQEQVFSLVALRPDVCIVRQERDDVPGIGGRVVINSVQQPFILVYGDISSVNESVRNDTISLKKEIHELCHINQYWHWVQQLQRDTSAYYSGDNYFENSVYGKKFIDLVGFIQTSAENWDLPVNSVLRDIYSLNPAELSAELCALYFLERIGMQSTYEYIRYDKKNERIVSIPYRTVDFDTYLTPEIREWLETYVVLPSIEE